MNQLKQSRWIRYVFVFVLLLAIWISIAGAAGLDQGEAASFDEQPQASFIPNSTTLAITIGAIVLMTIIITSVMAKARGHS